MYDYVIVGAGTAGCALAARLSEDPDTHVLLLEAGGPDTPPEIHIPAAFSKLFQGEHDWNYHTVPQPGAAGRRLFWPRGKVLGGSSAMNAMIYIRGHHGDFDGWAASGCDGWSYADVLPYFKRSEDNARGASAYHGAGGPLHVQDLTDPGALPLAFVEAAVAAGHSRNADFNGAEQLGAGTYQVTQQRGRRVSSATAFLKPAVSRPNLAVRTHAQVHRILVEHGRAVGLEVARNGVVETVRAGREVVLCGGAVNSPQLLMLSGIGPAADLRALGIDVVADRPGVGENLQDHLIVGAHFKAKAAGTLRDAEGVGSVLKYLLFRRGLLTSNIAEAGLFLHSPGSDGAVPDLQFHVAPGFFVNHGLDPISEHGCSLGPTHVRPASVGRLTLRSADPTEHPAIDPNALSVPSDVDALVAGMEAAYEIAARGPLADLLDGPLGPQPRSRSRADLAAYVRETCQTLYHPVGTCRMGADDDAVVDLDLRVRGVDGLRVVDASVMPRITNGNTNAPTLMIAEKAADLIRHGSPAAAASAGMTR